MGLKHDIGWTIEVMPSGKVIITGCLQISAGVKVDMHDYILDEAYFAKDEIVNIIKEKCFDYGNYSRQKNEYYMKGYIDAMRGFDPFDGRTI